LNQQSPGSNTSRRSFVLVGGWVGVAVERVARGELRDQQSDLAAADAHEPSVGASHWLVAIDVVANERIGSRAEPDGAVRVQHVDERDVALGRPVELVDLVDAEPHLELPPDVGAQPLPTILRTVWQRSSARGGWLSR